MVDPSVATAIIIGFLGVFGLILPVLNHVAPKYVSYRWCVVVAVLAMGLGVVVNFSGLSEETRHIVILGALIIAGGYVFLRTIEKALANDWLRGVRLDVRKGDASASVSSEMPQADASKKDVDNPRDMI